MLRVVCQQADLGQAQVDEDLHADAVVAAVGLEAQRQVGLDRVHAFVLQGVGAQLVVEADAAPFLAHVDDDAAPSSPIICIDLSSCSPQSQRMLLEHVARDALAVHAHQRRARRR